MSTTFLTAEDLWGLPENGMHLSLVRGVIVEEPLPGGEHGATVAAFGFLLIQWARASGAGVVGIRAGFILARNPDTILGPDLYFVRANRLPQGRIPTQFYDLVPDLAAEVISPSETAEDVQEKVRDYLAAGTSLVILVYPRMRLLIANAADGSSRTYREDETFSDPAILPGFSCRIAELFT